MSVKMLFLSDDYPAIIFNTENFNDHLKFDKRFKDNYNNWKYIPIDAKLDGR